MFLSFQFSYFSVREAFTTRLVKHTALSCATYIRDYFGIVRFHESDNIHILCCVDGTEGLVFDDMHVARPKIETRPQMSASKLSEEIKSLEKHLGGTKKLVQALQHAPGFEKFGRVTAYRWKNATKPNATIDFDRAAKAVAFLKNQKNDLTLKMAIPNTLQALPVMMLLWDDVYNEKINGKRVTKVRSPYGLLKRLGVCPLPTHCSGGSEALDLLRAPNSTFDVGFSAKEFGEAASSDAEVQRLCQVTVAKWSGVAKNSLNSIYELKDKRVGYHPRTAIHYKLKEIERQLGVKVESLLPSESAGELVQALQGSDGEKVVILGWEPLLSEIKTLFLSEQYEHLKDIPFEDQRGFAVEVDLFVRKTARPDAVRILLDALDQANAYASDKANADEIAKVCVKKLRGWGLQRKMVTETLDQSRTIYEIGDLNQRMARHLWNKEFAQVRAKNQ